VRSHDDGFSLSGTKCFISNGLNADVVIVAARPTNARGAESHVIVDVTEQLAGSDRSGFSAVRR